MSTTHKLCPSPELTADDELINPYLSRPFAPEIIAQAEAMVRQYRVVMWFEDGEYYGRSVELPGAGDDGPPPDACMSATPEAMVACAATMLEMGEVLPVPITEQERAEFERGDH